MRLGIFFSLISAVHSIEPRLKSKLVVPPGSDEFGFQIGVTSEMLEITTEVGLETSTNVGFCLDFLTKDIAITRVSSYEPNLSQTASRDLKHPSSLIVSYDAYYNKVLYQGTNYFDYFNFSSVMSLGQGFTYCDDASFARPSILGVAPGASASAIPPNYPSFVRLLWEQAQIGSRIISFVSTNYGGQVFLGRAPPPAIVTTVPTNYSADLNDGLWSMGFGGIYLGDLSLGYNGKMTVVYNSFFHMGPRSFFNIIRQRLGFTNSPITVGGVTFAQGPCAATYPNVTITLSGVNLTLTPDQYIRTSDAACVLGFATWNRTAPDGLPWTLGWALLHNTYTQFNYGQRTFGFAYLG